MRDYVARVRRGEDIDRPTAAIAAERDRITGEYRDAAADDEARAAFDDKLGLVAARCSRTSRTTTSTSSTGRMRVFWRKIRELASVLADAGFWAEADDMFYAAPRRGPRRALRLRQRLGDRRRADRPGLLAARRSNAASAIVDALETQAPPPALNEPPAVDHRAVHDHALRHHHRAGPALAAGADATATSLTRHGRLARHRRGRRRASSTDADRARRGPGGRDPRRRASPRRAGGRSSARSARRSPTSAA